MIVSLDSKSVSANKKTLKDLLKYCRQSSSCIELPDSYYEKKIEELIHYLDNNQAFFFVAKDKNTIIGFLWACRIKKDNTNVFHILYLAVYENYQNRGYGQQLIEAAKLKITKE